jgi:hypothetical protein
MKRLLQWLALVALLSRPALEAAPRNIIFILTDDHRFDAMGFAGHPFLETPHLDSIARNGVYLPNAFVTTALCSPSRASILTGQYAHRHGVVDNNNPVRSDLLFFPQSLQQAGYKTYDLQKDPGETTNLVFSAEHQSIVREMNGRLFETLKATDGMFIPLQPDRGGSSNLRREAGSKPAEFPRELLRKKDRNN